MPYEPTAAKSGGLLPPTNPNLPIHLVRAKTCKVAQLFKLQDPKASSLKLPSGCVNVALISVSDADLFVVEQLSDLDLKTEDNPQWVPWCAMSLGFSCANDELLRQIKLVLVLLASQCVNFSLLKIVLGLAVASSHFFDVACIPSEMVR